MRCFSLVSTILTAVFVGLFTAPAGADSAPMYVSDSANNLLTVDVNSGVVTRVEGTFAQMTDIAFSPTGALYGVTPSYLYEMDIEIGWDTLIGAHGYGDPVHGYGIDALTFDRNGNLYAAGNDILIVIDPQTGRGTTVGTLSGYRSAGDLAVTSTNRLLLSTDAGDLVEVHRDGSGATRVGSIPYDDIYAMAASLDGSIYGIRSTSEIVVIDQATAHARVIGELQRDFLYGRAWGASFPDQFVPEPVTAMLLLTGSLVLLHTGRKSKRNTTPAAI